MKRHGKDIHIWNDCIKYEGNLENVKSRGYGTFFLINGDVYHGFWKNSKANGKDIYIIFNGGIYEANCHLDGFRDEKLERRCVFKGY